jgi:hypothetical protein
MATYAYKGRFKAMLLDEEARRAFTVERFEWIGETVDSPIAVEVRITTKAKEPEVAAVVKTHNPTGESTDEKEARELKEARISIEAKLAGLSLTAREMEVLLGKRKP